MRLLLLRIAAAAESTVTDVRVVADVKLSFSAAAAAANTQLRISTYLRSYETHALKEAVDSAWYCIR